MKQIKVIDMTLANRAESLSFKEKIETARQLDRLAVSVIDLPEIVNITTDSLLVRTIAAFLKNSIISVSAGMSEQGIETAAAALSSAKNARVKISIPVSAVKMEYVCHKKPDKILELAKTLFALATQKFSDVEFFAEDATRAETKFLEQIIGEAVSAGVKTVTLCDDEGAMLPDEFAEFIKNTKEAIPALNNVSLGVASKNANGMATASALMAIKAGADEIKCAVGIKDMPKIKELGNVLCYGSERLGVKAELNWTEINRILKQIEWICGAADKAEVAQNVASAQTEVDTPLDANDTLETVTGAVKTLGYELSDEDYVKVYDEFCRLAGRKKVSSKELDAIVASVALQVPPTYQLISYVINNGNIITASAQITLKKDGKEISGISIGDGPVDASFRTLEQIIGHHFELDAFQIQSVTEGREAVGSAIVKLRHNGKLYSGNGVSTDIIGSSIRAYINAVNKIVYEEN